MNQEQEINKIESDLEELEKAFANGDLSKEEYERYKESNLKFLNDLKNKKDNYDSFDELKKFVIENEKILMINQEMLSKTQKDLADLEQAYLNNSVSKEEYDEYKKHDLNVLRELETEIKAYSVIKENVNALDKLVEPVNSSDKFEYDEEVNARMNEIEKNKKYISKIVKKVQIKENNHNLNMDSSLANDDLTIDNISDNIIKPENNTIILPDQEELNKKIILPGMDEYYMNEPVNNDKKIVLPGEEEYSDKKIYLPDGSFIDLSSSDYNDLSFDGDLNKDITVDSDFDLSNTENSNVGIDIDEDINDFSNFEVSDVDLNIENENELSKDNIDDNIASWIIDRVNNEDLDYTNIVKRSFDENGMLTRIEDPLIPELVSRRILLSNGGGSLGNDYIEKYSIRYSKVKDFISLYDGKAVSSIEEKAELINKIDKLFVEEVKAWIDKAKIGQVDSNRLMEVFKISEEEANKIIEKLNIKEEDKQDNVILDSDPIIPITPITPIVPNVNDYRTSIVKKSDPIKLEDNYKKRLENASKEGRIFVDRSSEEYSGRQLIDNNKYIDEFVDLEKAAMIPVRVFKEANVILHNKIELSEFKNVVAVKLSNLKNLIDDSKDYTKYVVDRLVEQMAEGKIDTDGNPIVDTGYDEYMSSRSMGFSKIGLIALLTGILSIGIMIFGTFLIR